MKAVRQYLELLKLSGVREVWSESSVAPVPVAEAIEDTGNRLATLHDAYKDCKKCPLARGRHFFVYGEGNPNAQLMLIGEGPGKDEDETGRPFVGKAGQLLTKMLAAIQLEREDVYIANVVKCRPPNNRVPTPEEAGACLPYLYEQIEIIRPRILLLLGSTAAKNLLQSNDSVGKFRETKHLFRGIPTFVSYHPSALLRDPSYKRPAWEDLKVVRKALDELQA